MAGIFIGAQMEKRYAQVIVDISAGALDRPFTYRVPEELRDRIRLGSLVEIPFGRASRKITGFVIGFSESCDYPKEKTYSVILIFIFQKKIFQKIKTTLNGIVKNMEMIY